MKKFFLLATIASLALASCDDVPAPYGLFDPTDPNNQGGGGDLPYTNANLKDWSAVSVKGANWDLGNTYAKASGYANGETAETEAWLVSPAISLVSDSSQVHITLDHVIGYVSEASPLSNHTMWIATDYSSDVATATWTQLSYVPKAWATPKDWTFYAADPITIPSEFIGQTVYIAFKFVCGASSTTWEINNLKIVEGGANIGGDTPPTPVEYEHISIADFIAKADANTTYEITGVASKLNANYASLDLTEDGATVYVYKMVDASGANVSFSTLDIAEGDTVTVTGKYYKYEKDGNVKHELNPGTYVSHKKCQGGTVTPPTPSGDAEAISIAEFLTKADVNTVYRLTGTVKNIANTTYGNFDLVDGESSIYIYGLLDKAGAAKNFASLGIKEGDKLTLEGKYVWYVDKDGNGKAEISNAQYISHESVGTTGGGENTGGGNGGNTGTVDVPAGEGILAAVMASNSELPSNSYGSQAVADEETWVNWKIGGISYKGVKVCQAPSTQVPNTLQMQGNASDAAKQGFLFNSDAFASDIKKITVVLKVKEAATTYDPGYSLYIGASAHPVSDVVEPKFDYTTAEGVRTYVQEFDLSGKSAKYFTIANDKQGALYIDKVVVELK